MKPKYYLIAQLITKYLEGTIQDDELSKLNEWLSEDPEHQEILDSFKGKKAVVDFKFLQSLDADRSLHEIYQKRKRYFWKKLLKVSVSAAVVLSFIFLSWDRINSYRNQTNIVNRNAQEEQVYDIQPGSYLAQLKLSDGSLKHLNNNHENFKEANNANIEVGDGQLVYSVLPDTKKETIYNEIIVPQRGMYRIVLSDGTKVWLNAMSELKFPVNFIGKKRKVYLKGEGYFEVAKDSERPFFVAIDNGTKVKVLGTHFNVNTNTRTTTLFEGSVKVSHHDQSEILKPGQAARIKEGIAVSYADLKRAKAWKEGQFYFKGDNIKNIMDEISRWYGVDIKYVQKPPSTGYSGSISRNVPLSKVLNMLAYVSGGEFKLKQNQVTISF